MVWQLTLRFICPAKLSRKIDRRIFREQKLLRTKIMLPGRQDSFTFGPTMLLKTENPLSSPRNGSRLFLLKPTDRFYQTNCVLYQNYNPVTCVQWNVLSWKSRGIIITESYLISYFGLASLFKGHYRL